MLEVTTAGARPFMKWAGGKGKLVPQLQQFYPEDFNNYFEPFFGGGAVFFSLQLKGQAQINDINDTLIDAYIHVRDDVEKLIKKLKLIEIRYKDLPDDAKQEFYYQQREKFNELTRGIEKTVILIFLNKTCFNGLYRENSKGKFNVPFGRYPNPTICDEKNLLSVSDALRKVTITSESYVDAVKNARKGDFVYLDPPYHPLTETSSFTAYHQDGFTAKNQKELRDLYVELDKRGCYVMLSNSGSEFIRELYANFRLETVYAGRNINATAAKRGKVAELLVLNY